MRNDTFFKNIFKEATTKCVDLDIIIPKVKRKKVIVRLDKNYSNQFFMTPSMMNSGVLYLIL